MTSALSAVWLISGRRWIVIESRLGRWWTLIAVAQLCIVVVRRLRWSWCWRASTRRSSLLVPGSINQRNINHQNRADHNEKLQKRLLLHFNAKIFYLSQHETIITK